MSLDETIKGVENLIERRRGALSVADEKTVTSALEHLKRMQWVPVVERMPEDGTVILFRWTNTLGKSRTSLGTHCGLHTHCAEHEDNAYEFPEEYDWDDEVPYRKPGWYEDPSEVEFYARVSDPVTHWMSHPL